MKQPIFILASLLCICGVSTAWASDSLQEEEIVKTVETPETTVEEIQEESDNIQVVDADYLKGTQDALAETRLRVDELLVPCESSQNLWTNDIVASNSGSFQAVFMQPESKPMVSFSKKHKSQPVQDGLNLGEQNYYGETVYIINNFLYGSDNVSASDSVYSGRMRAEYQDCPFSTQSECAVWLRKPVISETVAPRSKTLRDGIMCDISSAIEENPHISADDKVMIPLLQRYKVLMRASQSCCTGGLMHKLKSAGMKKESIYKFLADDANFAGFGARCVVMDDGEIDDLKSYPGTTATIADVRNECVCKSKETIRALLAPFEQLYADYPEFADAPFEYQHYDGVGRAVTDFINHDVKNVLHQLEMCP